MGYKRRVGLFVKALPGLKCGGNGGGTRFGEPQDATKRKQCGVQAKPRAIHAG